MPSLCQSTDKYCRTCPPHGYHVIKKR